MQNNPPVNFERIEEMIDGDADFRAELVLAIYNSLLELKEKYLEGAELQDEEIIQEIRHKVKPSLALFEIHLLNDLVTDGKDIIETQGFGPAFLEHLEKFLDAVDETIDYLTPHVKKIENGE